MKKRELRLLLALLFVCTTVQVCAQQTVTIKGTVKFTDKDFKIEVYRRSGTSKQVLASVPVNADHTYTVTVPFDKAGEAVVDCGKWQDVNVWLEDENLDIDFRGMDTARIKIKNPPYVYVKGGKKNELMNLVNFIGYRGYQTMIAISQNVYRAKIEDQKAKSDLSMSLYDYSGDDRRAWMRYLVEHYSDQNSVLVPIQRLNPDDDAALINAALARLEAVSPSSRQLVADYRRETTEAREHQRRMAVGQPAPDFAFQTVKGKKTSLNAYKGKVLVLDFWASWCGPCRQEIPNMKKFYEEFKGKGVEFLSVSIDAKKDAWAKAMNEEKMAWKQGWTTDAGKSVMDTYQFGGIPFIIVIDKDGNIYRKNVRGEGIKQAIADCLAGKKPGKTVAIAAMGM